MITRVLEGFFFCRNKTFGASRMKHITDKGIVNKKSMMLLTSYYDHIP